MTTRSILREARFQRLWLASTASGLATWALPFVLGLAVLERTLSGVDLGVVLAVRTVGFLVAVPVAGVLADRLSRQRVVVASGAAAAVATPAIALGLERSLLLTSVGALVVGVGQGACRPAFQALAAEVVDVERRQAANAALTVSVRVCVLGGPALSALVATVVGARGLLVGIALLWVVVAVLPPPGQPRPVQDPVTWRRLRVELGEAVAEARRHRWFVAGLGALSAVILTGYSVTGVLLPLVSRDRYGTEAVLAAAVTAYTLGALVGGLLMARWRPRAQGHAALAGLAAYAVVPLSLLVPGPAWLVVAAYVVAGIGIELFNVPWFTATQREVEPELLARVSSLDFLISYGLAPLGLALIAPAAAGLGVGPVLMACAVVCVLGPALAALVPSSRGFAEPAR